MRIKLNLLLLASGGADALKCLISIQQLVSAFSNMHLELKLKVLKFWFNFRTQVCISVSNGLWQF
jgi:hypothetical protein